MAQQHTVDVIKELGTFQPTDVKQEMSPDSEVPPELSVGEVTESSNTVDVMKELGTLQPPELVDAKQEISPDSKVPFKLCVGEVTESSKTKETPLKPCLEVIMEHMKTLVEQVEKSQGEIEKRLKSVEEQLRNDQEVIEKRLKSVEEQLGKDQGVIDKCKKSVEEQLGKDKGVIEKHLKSVEKRLEAVESSLPNRNQGVQPDMSVNVKDAYGNTLLVNAVLSRDITNITMLLKRGADVNIANSGGWLPLHHAAYNGFTEVCALLILVGNADINAKTMYENKTPLHMAAEEGQIKVVELLLKFGVDVSSPSSYACCAGENKHEIARLLDCAFNRDMFASSLNQPLKK